MEKIDKEEKENETKNEQVVEEGKKKTWKNWQDIESKNIKQIECENEEQIQKDIQEAKKKRIEANAKEVPITNRIVNKATDHGSQFIWTGRNEFIAPVTTPPVKKYKRSSKYKTKKQKYANSTTRLLL